MFSMVQCRSWLSTVVQGRTEGPVGFHYQGRIEGPGHISDRQRAREGPISKERQSPGPFSEKRLRALSPMGKEGQRANEPTNLEGGRTEGS